MLSRDVIITPLVAEVAVASTRIMRHEYLIAMFYAAEAAFCRL